MLRTFVTAELKKVPANLVPKDVIDLPGKVKLETKGNLGLATLTLKDDVVIGLIKAIFALDRAAPREAKPPVEKR